MSDYIPEEIQLHVFHFLPVKTLLRFRCVCKAWRAIIDSHSFVQSHLAVQKGGFLAKFQGPELLALDPHCLPDTSKKPSQYADPWQDYHSWPIGTLHGIVCLIHTREVKDEDGWGSNYDLQLWNPLIRRVVSIPGPTEDWLEPIISTYIGFWIDPSTKHFKIFLVKFCECYSGECYLYSSVRRDWKELHHPEVGYQLPDDKCPTLVIGEVAYWRAEIKYECYHIGHEGRMPHFDDSGVVWSFDFVREAFDMIKEPLARPEEDWSVDTSTMCNWQDNLSILYWDGENRYNLYSRQDGSWVNVLRVSLPPESSRLSCVFRVEEDHREIATVSRDPALRDVGADDDPMEYTSTIIRRQYNSKDLFLVYGYVESLLFPEKP